MIPNSIKQEQETSKLLNRGYIEESGSNSNGTWIKFSDGTIIMKGTKEFGNDGTFANSSFVYVQLPLSIDTNKDYTFYATPNYYSDFDGANSVILTAQPGKNLEVVYRRLSYYPASDSKQTELFAHNTKFNWLAIGRWK